MNPPPSQSAAPQPHSADAFPSSRSPHPRGFWSLINIIALVYLAILVAQICLRMVYPWDLLNWPESPFLTDMMKINQHRPVYSTPTDVNSFVYSPGLEYVTYALLKPFGVALDIRFCRLVNVVIGMLAAFAGVLAIKRLVRSVISEPLPRWLWLISWALLWLVLSTNPLSDLPHPDGIQALTAMLVFGLCFAAIETKGFGWALAAMAVAGIGVFSKQTGAVCFLGPAIVFSIYKVWGFGRWCVLLLVGLIGLGLSLWLLWLPASGRFFTLELLSHQPIEYDRALDVINWLFAARRGALACVCLLAAVCLWNAKGPCRRYLVCWFFTGIFSAGLNIMAYVKIMGLPNNLCLYEIWMFLLAWPVILLLPQLLPRLINLEHTAHAAGKARVIKYVFYLSMLIYVAALLPLKRIPSPTDYDFGRQIEAGVRRDVQAGRKVLVSHGAAFLIHCGITDPPLDRCNSALEIFSGNQTDLLLPLKGRIAAHQYDRIYLILGWWYGPDVLNEIHKDYDMETVIPRVRAPRGVFVLRGAIMKECTQCEVLTAK